MSRIKLKASEQLFKLTTEGVRIASNEEKRHIDLSTLITELLNAYKDARTTASRATMESHLTLISNDGDYEIDLRLSKASEAQLADLGRSIAKLLNVEPDFRSACSVLMLNYIADRESARIASRLGIPDDKVRLFRDVLKPQRGNIFPIRR